MRRAGAFAAVLSACIGCAGDGGAVSVRWELTDLTSGIHYDPREVGGPDDICQVSLGTSCGVEQLLRVHRIRLVIRDPVTGAPALREDDPRLIFRCRVREATTDFFLPAGTFALSLQAFDPAQPASDEGVTPAPAVRTIKRAEIVNLEVIDIGVHPLPVGPATAAPADLACPDGGR
jgi:hypothetical protein